jgi:hypothetical protein
MLSQDVHSFFVISVRKMLGGAIAEGLNAALDPFLQTETFESKTGIGYSPQRSALITFLTVLIVLSIILFAGKWLWNNVLHELVPAVKPAKSIWQILGLALLISLLSPGSCSC